MPKIETSYKPPVLDFSDTIKEAFLMVYRKDSDEAVVVHLKTTLPIDGNEDAVLRKLRNTGKYDTDQVVWLTEEQVAAIIRVGVVEEVSL